MCKQHVRPSVSDDEDGHCVPLPFVPKESVIESFIGYSLLPRFSFRRCARPLARPVTREGHHDLNGRCVLRCVDPPPPSGVVLGVLPA